jgi:hypothetical protein
MSAAAAAAAKATIATTRSRQVGLDSTTSLAIVPRQLYFSLSRNFLKKMTVSSSGIIKCFRRQQE